MFHDVLHNYFLDRLIWNNSISISLSGMTLDGLIAEIVQTILDKCDHTSNKLIALVNAHLLYGLYLALFWFAS